MVLMHNRLFEISDGEKGESSLFVSLSRPTKTEDLPLLITKVEKSVDGFAYQLLIYQDRIVGKLEEKQVILCLEGDISFRADFGTNKLWLKNQESGKEQSLNFCSKKELKQVERVLAKLCPQQGFFQKYQLVEQLGKGNNSQVFKVMRKTDGEYFACKIQKNSRSYLREIATLGQLDHPNLIYLREFYIEEDQMTYTLMDYEDGGSLLDIIRDPEEQTAKKKMDIIYDLLNAMEFMRIKQIVHRDIKPENILFSKKDGKYKLADFGYARRVGEKFDRIVGTPGYIAPEVIQENAQQITIQSDVYSMGLVFFQLFTGVQYYSGKTTQQILNKNLKGKSLKKKASSFDLKSYERDLLDLMIRTRPQNRKDPYEILTSQTFKKLNKKYQSQCRDSGSTLSKESDDEQSIMGTVKKLFHIRSSS